MNNKLIKVGIVGTIVAALCCATPILVILLGVVGLGAMTGYLDYVLLPTLVIFVLITVYGFWQKAHHPVSSYGRSIKKVTSAVQFTKSDQGRGL
jgi:mercuric ion transport protein